MDNIKKRLSLLNGTQESDYIEQVDKLIRKRYSISAELAILRQRDTKPEEFAAYNAYAEECKARAKEELGI
jgi:proline dehydrogenase